MDVISRLRKDGLDDVADALTPVAVDNLTAIDDLRIKTEQSLQLGLNNFGAISFDGVIEYSACDICYAKAQYWHRHEGWEYFMNVSKESILPKEIREAYVQWVVKRSPYAPLFLDKEDKLGNSFVMRVIHSGSYVISGAIMLRMLVEYPALIQEWYNLRPFVHNENVAYIMALYFNQQAPGSWMYSHTPFGRKSHQAFEAGTMKTETMKNWLAGNPVGHLENKVYTLKYRPLAGAFGLTNEFRDSPARKFDGIAPDGKIVLKSGWSDQKTTYDVFYPERMRAVAECFFKQSWGVKI